MGDRRNSGDHEQPKHGQQSQDWVALDWVRGEITETLTQARQSLEDFVNSSNNGEQDDSRLRFCLNYIHQIHGTLDMVEFYSAALLAEEMENLVHALINGSVPSRNDAHEVLMQAMIQLPHYLEQVQSGRRDLPVVILPILNDLRSARGENLLSETSLFTPDLSAITAPASEHELKKMESSSLTQLLKKLRQMYQFALVGFFKDPSDVTSQNYLIRVFERMESLCKGYPVADIWPVSYALLQSVVTGDVRNNAAVRNLLRQVDGQLADLINNGPQAFNGPVPEDLLKNSLFYIARSSSTDTRTHNLKERFKLDVALIDENTVNEERRKLSGPDRETMQSVIKSLSDELMTVKDALDLYMRNPGDAQNSLDGQISTLRQVADTLAVLGLGVQRKVILEQLDTLSAMVNSQSHDDNKLMDIAGSLLYVEATLSGMASGAGFSQPMLSDEPADLRSARVTVIQEACSGLINAKDAIVDFTATGWNRESLNIVPEILAAVRGSMAMIQQDRVSELVHSASEYIQTTLLSSDQEPEWQSMELLADVLAGVEYYLERLGNSADDQGEGILDLAAESLELLVASARMIDTPEADIPDSDEELTLELMDEAQEQEQKQEQEQDEAEDPEPLSDAVEIDLDLVDSFDQAPRPGQTVAKEKPEEPEQPEEVTPNVAEEELELDLDLDLELVPKSAQPVVKEEPVEDVQVEELSLESDDDDLGFTLEDIELSELDEPAENSAQTEPVEAVKGIVVPDLTLVGDEPEESSDLELTIEDIDDLPEQEEPAVVEPETAAESLQLEEDDDDELDEELVEIFIEEVGEVREQLSLYFPRWQADRTDTEALTEFRRAFHTLKGSGRMVGATVLGELGWSIENMLNRVIEGAVESTPGIVALVERVIALLPSLVEDYANNRQEITAEVQACVDEAAAWERGEQPTTADVQLTVEEPVQEDVSADELILEELSVDEILIEEDEAELEDIEIDLSLEDESAVNDEFIDISEAAADQAVADESSVFDSVEPVFDAELISIFSKEANTHLEVVEAFVEEFNESDVDALIISDDLQRALHTLKGSAGMAGVNQVAVLVKSVERMVKEFRGHGIKANGTVVSYLARCNLLIIDGIEQVNAQPAVELEIEGAAALIAEIDAYCDQRLSEQAIEETAQEKARSYGEFISRHMNLVLDAVPALLAWDRNPEASVARNLHGGLLELVDSAREVELDAFADLAEQMAVVYQAIQHQKTDISDVVIQTLIEAHDSLTDMMDRLAAQETPSVAESLLSRLQALIDELEEEPAIEAIQEAIQEVQHEAAPAANEPVVEEESDHELLAIFLDEAMDNLDGASSALQSWLDNNADLGLLTELQRYLHTIKGGARMAGIEPVSDLSHELEDIYEALCLNRLNISGDLINLLLRGHDALEEMLGAIRSHRPSVPAEQLCSDIRAMMQSSLKEAGSPAPAQEEPQVVEIEPSVEIGEIEPVAVASGPAVALPDDLDPEMFDVFREEAVDLLEDIERQINAWLDEPNNQEFSELLMRDLHTLKGSARMAGLSTLGELSHEFEVQVIDLQARKASDADEIRPLMRVFAELQEHFEATLQAVQNQNAAELQVEATTAAPVTNVVQFPSSQDSGERIAAPASVFLNQATERQADSSNREMVRVPAELIDQLVNLAGETSISRSRIEQQISDYRYTLKEMHATIQRLQEQLRRLDIETQAQILSRHEGELAEHPEFDPLEMDQYSELTQLSRSLVESATDLLDLKEALEDKNRDSETLLLQQSRINTELQEGLMRTRMLPFNRMLPRLRRIVRQVSSELGKEVELKVVNAEGEMDRSVMERMISPLEHMLRNAIDHGIEDNAKDRVAKGKNEVGEISINLAREGGEIVLSLGDDGRGLNMSAVRSKAEERGLLASDTAVSDKEISQLILQPGFSTATNVTQISGRGVGMDVVNSELKQLGGHIEINSEEGKGTEFEIRLPFTLSVNRALLVNIGEDQFAIPLNSLEGIVRLSPFELESHYRGDVQDLEYAGRNYQLHYLGELLNERPPRLDNVTQELPVLLIRSGENSIAIQVDSLVASREIVVKSLGAQFAGVRGVSGATILGDGRVVVILDPVGLLLNHTRRQKTAIEQGAGAAVEQENNLVMVVDDSVTVRKVTGRLLKRNGYQTLTARDGVEAMALLQEHRPAVILLDIEMPRMDGFEVATAVRNHPDLKGTPIIMITSRTGEKHRQRAKEIGVNDYMGKPFQEPMLLEAIASFAQRHD
ncbi:Hpt domain-containing protein [Parendozoicomonas haliclonae]|uniref:Chemotaxis protein CheA n=1 Tax=Parendozoicomonas haliclonae TaxID=1960125 RepID=A0A1X7ALL3_9GAMM|nr:Hpt domain-containing protein [Parendozoicomonas haliclonae]SMA46087.1 Chemotaxis protein CheA [Parendozoicomonas haliclonae]